MYPLFGVCSLILFFHESVNENIGFLEDLHIHLFVRTENFFFLQAFEFWNLSLTLRETPKDKPMKHSKLTLLLCAIFSFAAISIARADTVTRDASVLPAPATQFIQTNFKDDAISHIKVESHFFSANEYEVVLNSGVEIEFGGDGQWKSIEAKKTGVPAALVPEPIAKYLAANFLNTTVKKIKRDRHGYEVELSSGLEAKFDKQMKFLRLDD